MSQWKVPVQSLIDHIKTAVDVDPWAKEMVEELLKEDEEIVRCKDCKHWWKENELCTHENTMHGNVCCLVAKADWGDEDMIKTLNEVRDRVERALKSVYPSTAVDMIIDIDDLYAMNDAIVLLKRKAWNVLTEDADGFIHGLPGCDGQYFMTDGKDVWIDDYVDGVEDGIFLDSGRDIREIKAWMYMPELPKQDRR